MPPGPAFKNKPTTSQGPSFRPDGTDLVFARLAAMLRSSPELHGCTVRAWDDPSVDMAPVPTDGPPWLRITPSPGPSAIHSRSRAGIVHRMPLSVAIETSVPGTQVGLSQKFWGAILRALFPTPKLDARLQALGVTGFVVTKAGWGAPQGDPPCCEGAGEITLMMYFTTPE